LFGKIVIFIDKKIYISFLIIGMMRKEWWYVVIVVVFVLGILVFSNSNNSTGYSVQDWFGKI